MRISDDPELFDRVTAMFQEPMVQETVRAIDIVRQKIYEEQALLSNASSVQPPSPSAGILPYSDIAHMNRMDCLNAFNLSMILADVCILGELKGDIRFAEDAGFPAEVLAMLLEGRTLIKDDQDSFERILSKKNPYILLSLTLTTIASVSKDGIDAVVLENAHKQEFQTEFANVARYFDRLCRMHIAIAQEVSFPEKLLLAFAEIFEHLLVYIEDPSLQKDAKSGLAEFRQIIYPLPKALQPDSYLNQMRPVWRERFKLK